MAQGGSKAKRARRKRARQRRLQAERKGAEKAHGDKLNALRTRLEPEDEPAADNLARLRGELDAWLAPHDAYDVIASLALGAYLDRESDAGHHPQLNSYVVEYGATTLLRRTCRAASEGQPNANTWDGEIQTLDFLLNRTLIVSRDVEGAAALASESLTDAERRAQYRYMGMQLFGHDPVPPEREIERLMVLFSPFEEALYQRLGFTAVMAAAIYSAMSMKKAEGLAGYFGLAAGLDPLEVRVELQKQASKRDPAQPGLILHEGLGSAMSVSSVDVGEMIGFPAEVVDRLFGRLKIGFGDIRDGEPWQQIRRFRHTPLVEDESGNWLAPVPYDILYVIRGLLEDALRDEGLLEPYQQARAKYLEEATRESFEAALSPDFSLRSLAYEHPEDGEVKLPEGDGLIVVDGITLACEAKAGGLSPAARGGEPKALAGAFNKLLFEAIEQAERTRDALTSGRIVKGVDETTKTVEVDPTELSQVVPVAVTLEDLSGPSAMLWELMDREPTGVDPADWPWIVNIDDLHWFSEELPMAAELVHYVLVRQRLASAGKISVGNEADWFRFYRNQGAARAQEIIEGAQEGEFHSTALVVSDARRGRFDPDLPPIELAVAPLVKRLDEERPAGWLAASLALLDLHPEQGVEALSDLPKRLQRTENGYIATATMRPAADPETALTIRVGSLSTKPHKREGQLIEGDATRRVVLALDGSPERPAIACKVKQPALVEEGQ